MENKYLLGCCINKNCTEYNGGWKYPIDYTIDEQEDCYCPGCGDTLKFIIQEES